MSSKQAVMVERFSCSNCSAIFRSGYARCPLCGGQIVPLDGDPLVGTTLDRRYEVLECVGEGGMGRVYRAIHKGTGKDHAIKVLFGDHAADPKMRKRMGQEARAVGKLSHRNVISVSDAAPEGDPTTLFWLAMDYVRGENLARLIEREAPFDEDRVLNLAKQLCLGLGHAHERGIVHRDFKSENVLVTRDAHGELAKIVDFGIAVVVEAAHDSHKLTTEGMVLGTPAFMSPEQATGARVDARTDLFSLGVLMYEMLCGKLPFDGRPLEIARQNLVAQPPRLAERVSGLDVDPELERIVFGLMAKRPEERFQSAGDVLRALDKVSIGLRHTPPPGFSGVVPSVEFAGEEATLTVRDTQRAPSQPGERISDAEFELSASNPALARAVPQMTGLGLAAAGQRRMATALPAPKRTSGALLWVLGGFLITSVGIGAFAFQSWSNGDEAASPPVTEAQEKTPKRHAPETELELEPVPVPDDAELAAAGDKGVEADSEATVDPGPTDDVSGTTDHQGAGEAGADKAADSEQAKREAEARKRAAAEHRRRVQAERERRRRLAHEKKEREEADRRAKERALAEAKARQAAAKQLTSDEQYRRLHQSVGRRLDRARLSASHRLVQAYFSIQYQSGIINQSVRKQNIRKLRWISAQLKKMGK